MLYLTDSHSHLDAAEFDADRSDVLARARAAGVTRQILPAVAFDAFPAMRDLCAREPGLYPAYGLHPLFLAAHRAEHIDALGKWIEHEQPVAVGECGLDFYVAGLDPETQRMIFQRQLEIAKDLDLPLILQRAARSMR